MTSRRTAAATRSAGSTGDTLTTLVGLRNTHGRGNFLPRLVEKESLVYERENSALVVLSNRTDNGFDSRTVQTAFAPGTYLVEMTGNSGGDIPELVQVNGDGTVNLRVQRAGDGGYLVYGPADAAGGVEHRRRRVGSRRRHADRGHERHDPPRRPRRRHRRLVHRPAPDERGQPASASSATPTPTATNALFSVNGGTDANNNGLIDFTTPGSVAYGFERFLDKSSPLALGGDGEFLQTVDASELPEGLNYVEVRAFRQRTDGGPAVLFQLQEGALRRPPRARKRGRRGAADRVGGCRVPAVPRGKHRRHGGHGPHVPRPAGRAERRGDPRPRRRRQPGRQNRPRPVRLRLRRDLPPATTSSRPSPTKSPATSPSSATAGCSSATPASARASAT